MLNKLFISGFKAIDEVELEINNLTLLMGMNSSGKSTVIQSILLAIQNSSFENNSSYLNGLLVSLGEFHQVRNYIKNSKDIIIKLQSNECDIAEFKFYEENGKVILIKNISSKSLKGFLNIQNKNIRYLSSERIGSKDIYEINYNRITDIGFLGEYAIDFIEQNKSTIVNEDLILDKETGKTLESQVNYWLKYIINSEIQTNSIEGTDVVKASYRVQNNSRYFRPKNVGAGMGYLISIIITLLSSEKGNINLIENPEIHLHPRAQSRLMEFMTFISDKGVKVIIETHSDHIFNGLRKSILQTKIKLEDVSAYYFDLNEDGISKVNPVVFNEKGKVRNYYEGLFDQFDEDLDVLLGL